MGRCWIPPTVRLTEIYHSCHFKEPVAYLKSPAWDFWGGSWPWNWIWTLIFEEWLANFDKRTLTIWSVSPNTVYTDGELHERLPGQLYAWKLDFGCYDCIQMVLAAMLEIDKAICSQLTNDFVLLSLFLSRSFQCAHTYRVHAHPNTHIFAHAHTHAHAHAHAQPCTHARMHTSKPFSSWGKTSCILA